MAGENLSANPNDTSGAFDSMAEALGAGVQGETGVEDIIGDQDPQFGTPHVEEPQLEGAPIEGADPEQGAVQQDQIPEGVDNANSYRYFQSKYSRSQTENDELRAQLQQAQAILSQFSNGQPANNLNNGALGSAPPAQNSQDPMKRPEAPTLPSDFDETDADGVIVSMEETTTILFNCSEYDDDIQGSIRVSIEGD